MTGPATADEVWIQEVGRASAEADCPTTTADESASGWSGWGKSYSHWMNDYTGGWTCQRSNVWARSTTGLGLPSGGCVFLTDDGGEAYVNFAGGYALPGDEGYWAPYTDSTCTSFIPVARTIPLVYAPSPYDPQALCEAVFGLPATSHEEGSDVWICGTPS